MSKKYTIIIHDITFEKVDEEGEPLLDAKGNVIVYEAPNADCSWVTDAYGEGELERMLVPVKEEQNA